MADRKGGVKRDNKVSRKRPRSFQGLGEVRGLSRRERVDQLADRMTRGQSTDHMN